MIQHQDCVVRYRYEDFILKLRRTEIAHEYVVGAQASNRGPIERPVVLPQWSEDTSIIYSSQEQDRVKIKQFGSELFDTLFQGAILALYHQCLEDIVQARDTSLSHLRGLRIILDLQDAPYLIHIPWEFLYDAEANQFLCLDPRTPVVRLLCQGARFSQVEPSLRCFLLSAAAPPEAQQPLREAEEEIKEIQKILRDSRNIEVKGHFPSARADDLLDIMKEGYHIVHFTGHGLEDQLVFDDRRLSDEQIRSIFTTNPALRLVVINACLAGQKVTEALARSGIPAIIGFQFEITDKSGRVFAQEFYKNLAAGYPLEASLHRGRVALLTELPDFEWAGPVLYLQATSSEEVLGDTLPVDKEKGAKLDLTPPDAKERLFRFLLERGKKSSGQGHYQKAIALLEGADGLWEPEFGVAKLDIGKDIQRCQTELEEKRRKFQNKLSKKVLFEKAQNYASEQPRDWDNAFNLLQVIGQLEELEELSRSRGEREQDRSTLRLLDREMNELFQHVRDGRSITHECQKREIRLKALYDQGEEGRHKQDWDQAIIFFEEAAREVKTLKDRNVEVDERYQDAERLANEARNQKDLHELYQCGVSLLEQELWHGAVNVFEQLRERALSYPGLDAQLAKARRERDAKDTYDRGMHAIQNGDWEVAIRDLRTIQPGAHCYQKADLALQYAQGCFYMEQEQWAQAVKVLADVVGR
ncbi:MAG: CHAT domain-containing protein, partial [Anaerolineae bacterium]